ncbi:hypothetical protein [Flavobacterium phycosphaerae]|uniref:hypothetical protein n=1 Tax=Flavobacterium phycosphaerae TaxID=2697515 RepID=UPI001389A698|nr:hypothetical protein [Flavobacterium phycosphaerae]
MSEWIPHIFTPIKILVLLTFILGLLYLNKQNTRHKVLLCVLFVSVVTEMGGAILTNLSLLYSIAFIVHNTLWLSMLFLFKNTRFLKKIIIAYVVFCVFYFLYKEVDTPLNTDNFIIGAFIYLFTFLTLSFKELKAENIVFFQSNRYLLLCSPLIFFFGYSIMFGFGDHVLTGEVLFRDTLLYDFVSYLSNIIYYLLILLYIYTEKRKDDKL